MLPNLRPGDSLILPSGDKYTGTTDGDWQLDVQSLHGVLGHDRAMASHGAD